MYLKSLVLQGFKSFADKTVLQFGREITAIVGPNGSGKSNISDAIRWVMGEQSTKNLRGTKMEDVIFGGTKQRPQRGFAEASLILDNSDGAFPFDAKEIMITRRYYRSGESEFYINKQSARLRDVNELFLDTGLGKEGYSNISQGRIDEILSMKGNDRREIFEEAAGISKYRHRKEETVRTLKATEENLLRIGDKIAELEQQVEPLREEAEKARQYLALQDELKDVEVALWLDHLERLGKIKQKAEEDARSAAFILRQEQTLLEELYRKTDTLRASLREFDAKMEQKRLQISETTRQIQQQDGERNLLLAKIAHHDESAARVRRELEEQTDRSNGLAEQIAEQEQRIVEIQTQTNQMTETLSELEQKAESLSTSGADCMRAYLTLQTRLDDAKAQNAICATELASAEVAAQEADVREHTATAALRENQEKAEQFRLQAASCQTKIQQANDAVIAARNRINGHRLRLERRETRKSALQQDLNQKQVRLDTLTSRIQLLQEMEREFEGYSKAVRLVMQAKERGKLPRVHGPVSKLIRTEEAYTVAIETALGAATQHIVVETEEDGKAGIQMLKRRDGGRATFLPMNLIRENRLREQKLEQTRGFVGIAADLVSCAACYREIVQNLLGKTVVTADLDAAVSMARTFDNRFRIVTLDGQVIHPGGAMTGGSASQSAGILSRANELERLRTQYDQLQMERERLQTELRAVTRETESLQYEQNTAAEELRLAEDDLLRLHGEARHYTGMLETIEAGIAANALEQQAAASRKQTARQIAAEKQAQAIQLEEQIKERMAELKSLEQNRAVTAEQMEQIRAEMQRQRLAQAAAEAEQDSVRRSIRQLQTLAVQMQGDRGQREAMLIQYAEEAKAARETTVNLERQLQNAKNEEAVFQSELTALTKERMEIEAEKTVAERDAQDQNRDILNMERECARLEQKKLSAEMEEKQNMDRLWETYGLTPSTAANQLRPIRSVPQAQRQITELKRQIRGLGTPNLGAIAEFDRVHDRYTYLTTQRDDVMTSKRDLEAIIHSITGEMNTIFTTEFSKINQYFGETFQEMFGGGQGSLELEDPAHPLECGIEIRVQPPGKQLKTITLLSGGEKAFVAIALYFAILKVRPTPFCMLDEIDAALDDRNVARFAAYLRSMSHMTQFIIVTHRRGTMEEADALFGVTMQEQGISKVLHLDLNQMTKQFGITK